MGAEQIEAGRLLCLRIALGVDESGCKFGHVSADKLRELKAVAQHRQAKADARLRKFTGAFARTWRSPRMYATFAWSLTACSQ
jgi:hypothetical protein